MGKETLLVLMGLLWVGMGYGTVITRSTATTASITNFYQDFSYCGCDLTASLCDNYCCCDGFCSSVSFFLKRVLWPLGLLPMPVCLRGLRLRPFAISHRSQVLALSMTSPVFTIQIRLRLGIIFCTQRRLPSLILPLQNCKKILIKCLENSE